MAGIEYSLLTLVTVSERMDDLLCIVCWTINDSNTMQTSYTRRGPYCGASLYGLNTWEHLAVCTTPHRSIRPSPPLHLASKSHPQAQKMGNKQSKLSPEQIQDLTKHTYCQYTTSWYSLYRFYYDSFKVDKNDLQQWFAHFFSLLFLFPLFFLRV